MKKMLIILIVTAAFAAPTAALAHGGHGNDSRHHGHGLYAKLTGTGPSFAAPTATASGSIASGTLLGSGTFNASLTTTWSSATTKQTGRGTLSCAPATATLSVVGAASTDTAGGTLSGKTCALTKSDGTVVRGFFGRGTATAAGVLAPVNATRTKLFLVQKADGSVSGAVWAGSRDTSTLFSVGERQAEHKVGDCDH
jgi:hypothetical protein